MTTNAIDCVQYYSSINANKSTNVEELRTRVEDCAASDIENNDGIKLEDNGNDVPVHSTPGNNGQGHGTRGNKALSHSTVAHYPDVEHSKEKNDCPAKGKRKKCAQSVPFRHYRQVKQEDKSDDHDDPDPNACQMLYDPLGLEANAGSQRLCDKCGKLVGGKHKCHRERKNDAVQCPECGIQCSTRPNLRRHMMQHTGERPHLCQHCGEGFIQRQSLQDHVTSYHPETVPNDPCIVVRQCPDCGETFYKSGQLQKHVRSQCGMKISSTLSAGSAHISREHDPLRPYACLKCERRFKLRASLIIHDRVHAKKKTLPRANFSGLPTGTRRRDCTVCGKKAMSADQWRTHMATHTGEPSHVCKTCGKGFQNRMVLVSHERIHTGEKPFACSICNKKFTHSSELHNHVRVHTDEKPFECSICGKKVRQNAHLQSHMRTHTGEKPFGCQRCEKSYKNLVDLRFHYRRMHQIELPKKQARRSIGEELEEGHSV